MAAQNPDELFDVVDEEDNVIGQATRAVVHARGLFHRAVHIFLFNQRGELLIQQRSAAKDEFPLCWTSSASGHVDAGEEYLPAAQRELEEELGLREPLQFVLKLPPSERTANEQTVLFRADTTQEPRCNREEIAVVRFLPLPEIVQWIERQPEVFCPPFCELISAWPAAADQPPVEG